MMETRTLDSYVRMLGLKPVFIGQLMTDHGMQQPWRVAAIDRGSCTVLGFDAEGAWSERRALPGISRSRSAIGWCSETSSKIARRWSVSSSAPRGFAAGRRIRRDKRN